MDRYVFYPAPDRGIAADAKALGAARRACKSLGVTVVRAAAGSMLVEAEPTEVREVAKALPGWCYSAEKKGARLPERTPLQRARLAAAAKG